MAAAGIHLYQSNRTECLVDQLAQVTTVPLGSALSPEILVVQGRGMETWLSLELANRHQIWANARFLYPRHLIHSALQWVLGDAAPAVTDRDDDQLFWALMATLPEQLQQPDFAPLRDYLAVDPKGRRMLQLCERLADTFDQYLTYRPEVIRAWERERVPRALARSGADAGSSGRRQLNLFQPLTDTQSLALWQPQLWRALLARMHGAHWAALEQRFLHAAARKAPSEAIPERLCIFGLSNLPPLYVRVLFGLSLHTQIHLFSLLPRPETSSRSPSSLPPRAAAAQTTPESHPLLRSLGQLGREFAELLATEAQALGLQLQAVHHSYQSVPTTTLLGRLQNSLLEGPGGSSDRTPFTEEDYSIRIHSCHGPMREVEVLYDQLLDLLTGSEAVAPHEVVILTPDVECYAPFLQAVFDRDPRSDRRIPYRIADRSLRRESALLDAFLTFLALVDERVTAPQVLDFLATDVVRERFDLSSEDLETITTWITQAGVRWGMDAEHREAFGLPKDNHNTWKFGLERLLLGVALPTRGSAEYGGVLPYDEVEGQDTRALGQLAEFIHRLFTHLRAVTQPRTLEQWRPALSAALGDLFVSSEQTEWQHQKILQALTALCDSARRGGFEGSLQKWQVAELLSRSIDEREPARGFLAGGVTVGALIPMRALPFRVVCLLGMNDSVFPRREPRNEFDLLLHTRRLGDRSHRVDDRYLFLETLLSARERLIITYTGQSTKDNASLPPSVVVSELLEFLEDSYADCYRPVASDGRATLRGHLVTEHPLQPFSPRYFDARDPYLFSYQDAYVAGALALSHAGKREPQAFFAESLSVSPQITSVQLRELAQFIASPAKHLLTRRLHLLLGEDPYDVPSREPHQLDGLQSYQAGSDLLQLLRKGVPPREAEHLLQLTGQLPAGTPGVLTFQKLQRTAGALFEVIRQFDPQTTAPPLHLTHRLSLPSQEAGSGARSDASTSRMLLGEIPSRVVWPDQTLGLLHTQYARLKPKSLLTTWLYQLAHCCARPGSGVARLVARTPQDGETAGDAVLATVRSVADAEQYLGQLIGWFELGRDRVLPFYAHSSFVYAYYRLLRDASEPEALQRASSAWKAELSSDPYCQKAFGLEAKLGATGATVPDLDPRAAAPNFARLAEAVFEPLFDHLELTESILKLMATTGRPRA